MAILCWMEGLSLKLSNCTVPLFMLGMNLFYCVLQNQSNEKTMVRHKHKTSHLKYTFSINFTYNVIIDQYHHLLTTQLLKL